MRHIPILTIAAAALLMPAARAQEAADQPDRAERRQQVIAAFDADGDGELNDEERAKAREELGGAGERADRPDRPRRDREGRGPRPEGPPDLGRLFDRFDEDGDEQLSRDEFTKLTGSLREMRDRWGGQPRGGRGRADRDNRPGPPPGPPEDGGDRPPRRRGDIGDGEDFRPLQNPGPPPRREDERGYRGPEDDSGARGPRDGRPREGGPREGGPRPERMGPPNPERLFNDFDANQDNQLSRDEFRELTVTLRDRMGDFRGRGGPPDGARGRGRRPGPSDGPPRPPRPPRPEFESVDPPETGPDANSA